MNSYMITVVPKTHNDGEWINVRAGQCAVVKAESYYMAVLIAGAVFSHNDADWDPSQCDITATLVTVP